MKTDPRYVTERFLAAFDAAQASTGASDEVMEEAVGMVSSRHPCVRIRQLIAGHMAARGPGDRRIPYTQIAKALGVGTSQVHEYLRRFRAQEAA